MRISPVIARTVLAVLILVTSCPGTFAQSETFLRRAESGDLLAIGNLARFYRHKGELEKAARWFRRGAELGDDDLQISLAWLYVTGRGVPRDEREAFRWYSEAARNFNEYAYFALAELYAAGKGTDRDLVEALAHLDIALIVLNKSQIGLHEKAHALKTEIERELSQQQVEQARRRASQLRPDVFRR